jgi:hypothetical protein
MPRALDPRTHPFSQPGTDTRQWCSYGIVKADTPSSRSVLFKDEQGNPRPYPVVLVTLQPSGIDVVCRVAHTHGGAGTGGWRPYVAGDEVAVAIMQGDEHDCVILGRLNNGPDAFPTSVAGSDPTKNNLSFDRYLEPFVLESGTAILLREAATGAFLSLNNTGNAVLQSGDGHYLAIQHDQITLQTEDLTCTVQIDPSKHQVFLQASDGNGGASQLLLDSAGSSTLLTSGTLTLTTGGGGYSQGHAITLEQVIAFLFATVTTIGPFFPTPLTPAQVAAAMQAIIPLAATSPVTAFAAAITAALQVPPDPTGNVPGAGRPSTLL